MTAAVVVAGVDSVGVEDTTAAVAQWRSGRFPLLQRLTGSVRPRFVGSPVARQSLDYYAPVTPLYLCSVT
jgi:hypothetical protein